MTAATAPVIQRMSSRRPAATRDPSGNTATAQQARSKIDSMESTVARIRESVIASEQLFLHGKRDSGCKGKTAKANQCSHLAEGCDEA